MMLGQYERPLDSTLVCAAVNSVDEMFMMVSPLGPSSWSNSGVVSVTCSVTLYLRDRWRVCPALRVGFRLGELEHDEVLKKAG